MTNFEQRNEIRNVAETIHSQITATTPWNVYFSWGVSRMWYDAYNGMASLIMRVNGLRFKGDVCISYNRGYDTYEIRTFKGYLAGGAKCLSVHEDVYAEELGRVLDNIIEKDISWTTEQYQEKCESEYANEICE